MLDGLLFTFEVFGLHQGVLTMIDRETGTVWTHLDGKALRGPLDGSRMGLSFFFVWSGAEADSVLFGVSAIDLPP